MDALNPVYVKQCEAYLQSMGLTEEDFFQILDTAHEIMRKDAEEERNQVASM